MTKPAEYLTGLFSLDGLAAVVVGGTGVLCGRMARCLALAGAKVVVAGRSEEKGAARVAEIEADGGEAVFHKVDVGDRDSLVRLADLAGDRFGGADILVNGAGVNSATPYAEIGDEEWRRILDTNLASVHAACQIFSARMVERGVGSIVNITSVSAEKPLSRVFAYSASKAALLNYTRNLARELGPTGVRVNALSPGFFPAEQNRKILDEGRVAAIMNKTPMNRFGEPSELDGALLLLASPKAGAFVTGAHLLVDGGFTAMSI